jgi:endonuclease/exonuclease/phosphatase (EEP) superfamily protein YafD
MNTFLIIFTILLILSSVLSLIKHDYWTFRVFDYPRLQLLILSICCLGLMICFFEDSILHWVLGGTLSLHVCYLFSLIFPFTILSSKQVLDTTTDAPQQQINLMISNVFEDNTNSVGCLAEVDKANPDVLLLLETNERWDRETRQLEQKYPHYIRVPMENTYGMLLYSKFPLSDSSVKYLVEDDIPSIHTKVQLKNGMKVQLYAVHPTPPVPKENVRATERDKELLLVADLAKAATIPVIVMGDLNDVAWSHTTELFLKMSGLLDPRRGRGFFNTFHAHHTILRFPLDHAFTSKDFKLNSMRRLENFDSDHFPMFVSLQYEAIAVVQQDSLKPDTEDIEEAQEKKEKI